MKALTAWMAALSCWWMGFLMFRAWWFPRGLDGGRWVKYGVGIMVFEFLVVHAGFLFAGLRVFSGSRLAEMMPRQVGFVALRPAMLPILLAGVYLLFALAMAVAFHSRTLFLSFVFVMAMRLVGFWSANVQSEAVLSEPAARSVISVVLYLLVVTLSCVVSYPSGGIDYALLEDVYADRGDGLWEQEPQRALAAGGAYFLLMGLAELALMRRFEP